MSDQPIPAWNPPAPDTAQRPLATPQFAPPTGLPVAIDGPAPAAAIPANMLPSNVGLTFADPQVTYDAVAVATAQGDHPTAHSMPDYAQVHEGPAVHGSPALDAEPDAVAAPVDPTGVWWSPGYALVAAMLAIAWQLVATYARERLPAVMASGQPIDRFDTLADRIPLAGGVGGQVLGLLLVVAAIGLLYAGWRQGVRERGLQVAIGVVAVMALVAPLVLVKL